LAVQPILFKLIGLAVDEGGGSSEMGVGLALRRVDVGLGVDVAWGRVDDGLGVDAV
jgi:hypothetical protein